MNAFAIDEGPCGAGTGSYEAGLLTLSDGGTRGVETVTRVTLPDDGPSAASASRRLPGLLGTLRGVLPSSAGLPMPARLAVSSMRGALGAIEEGFAPAAAPALTVEIAFADGASVLARMPPELIAAIRRDREIARGVLTRSARASGPAAEPLPVAQGTSEALTSIFRYEKRNGRLRRIAEPDPSPND